VRNYNRVRDYVQLLVSSYRLSTAFSTDFNDFEHDLTYMFYRVSYSVSEHSKQLRLTPV